MADAMSSTNENAISIVKPSEIQAASFDVEQCLKLTRVAEKLWESKLFPNVMSAAGAFAVVQCGLELGLQPMQALNNIDIIKGKLCLNAKTMLSLMIRAGIQYEILESTDKICRMKFSRGTMNIEVSYSMEEAKAAGLIKEGSGWMKYPSDMLFARCISRASRRIAPDVIQGLYTPEEMEELEIRNIRNAKNVTPAKSSENSSKNESAPAETSPRVETVWELVWDKEWLEQLEAVLSATYEPMEKPLWNIVQEDLDIYELSPLNDLSQFVTAVKEYFSEKAAEAYAASGKKVTTQACVESIPKHPQAFVSKFVQFRKEKGE